MSRTVLLIDDDLQFYGQLCQQLSGYDFEVHQAGVSDASLAMAKELAADLVFIAVDLPDKEGFALCHKAKKLISAPIILKTNTIPPEGFQKHSRLKSRADAYLDERTLTQDELLAHVDSLIGLGPALEDDGADVGIEMEEVEMDEIDLDDFGTDAYEDEATVMPNDFLDESTKVAPSSPFLDGGLDAEADAAFAALGFDDDKPLQSFDTSDVAEDYPAPHEHTPHLEEVTAVATDEAVDAAEAEAAVADLHVDGPAEEEDASSQGPITHVAPDDVLSDDLEVEPNYVLDLDEEDEIQAAEDTVPLPEGAVPLLDDAMQLAEEAVPLPEDAVPLPIEESAISADLAPEEEPALEAIEQEEIVPVAPETVEEQVYDEPTVEPFVGVETQVDPDDDLDLGLAAIAETAQEEQHAASQEDHGKNALIAENARLKAELASAKKASTGESAGFSREHEFLDLRERINKKEKALLDAQDQVTAKDRELLDGKDKLRQLERSKAELDEKNLQLEHEILAAKERHSALQETIKAGQEELVRAQAEAATALADAATAQEDIAALEARQKQELSKARSEHEAARAAAMEAAQEAHEAKLAQLESSKQSELAQAAAKLSEELAAAEIAKKQALEEQAGEHSATLASLQEEREAAAQEFEQAKQALADQHAGKFSRLERESQEARESLEAAQQSASEEAEARHQEALAQAATRHQEAVQEAQEAAAAALAAAKEASSQALAQLAEQHREASEAATKGHENAMAEASAAAEARRTQELEVAAQNLQSLEDRRREELNAAAEEREASEAQLLAKANQDRAGLEAEHGEVVANFERESAELRTALSTSRDKIAEVEAQLAGAQRQVEEQSAELQSKDQIIALRDDRVAALKGEIAELEEQNASYQEQVLKAYQKIKSDESTTARAKKALAIALTLLDESADLAVDTETPPAENESRS